MNSTERKAARRKRREEKRALKRAKRLENCTLEAITDMNALYLAQRHAARGVSWKASTQRYQAHWLLNINRARRALLAGEDICLGFHEFDLIERGKLRHISSVHFSERVVHKSLTQNVLIPAIVPSLIQHNTANIKGRGTAYAIECVKQAMRQHYRAHSGTGYVLQADFSDYFASIPHSGVFELLDKYISDECVKSLARHLVEVQGDVGLGLGSEPNQIYAVSIPNRLDHFITEMCGVEAYVRYMDDFLIFHTDKQVLHEVLDAIFCIVEQLGLKLHPSKTHITKLTRGFTFLKKKFSYSETGKVVVRPCRDSITRERRKLKGQARLVAAGEMSVEQVVQSYQSWRGSVINLDAHRTVLSMDKLFVESIANLEHNTKGLPNG